MHNVHRKIPRDGDRPCRHTDNAFKGRDFSGQHQGPQTVLRSGAAPDGQCCRRYPGARRLGRLFSRLPEGIDLDVPGAVEIDQVFPQAISAEKLVDAADLAPLPLQGNENFDVVPGCKGRVSGIRRAHDQLTVPSLLEEIHLRMETGGKRLPDAILFLAILGFRRIVQMKALREEIERVLLQG